MHRYFTAIILFFALTLTLAAMESKNALQEAQNSTSNATDSVIFKDMTPEPQNSTTAPEQQNTSNQTQTNEKVFIKQAFDGEDLLILRSLDAQQHGDFKGAAKLYKELYDKSQNTEYLKSSIRFYLATDDTNASEKLISEAMAKYPQDYEYTRFLIGKLLKTNNITQAKKVAEDLVTKEPSEQNLRLLAAIELYLKNFKGALSHLQSAYAIDQNEQILLQMSDIYLQLGNTSEALSQLETYTRLNGCTVATCAKLIDIYGRQQNINGLLDVYKRLYEMSKDDNSAQKVLEILMFQKKRDEAVKFLEKSGYKPDILIELYTENKQFDKAMDLADKMYNSTEDLSYVAKMAILEYENATQKTPDVLRSVSDKFERSINAQSEALHLNYYGYLLIDHDLNVTKGLDLVRRALEIQPDSPYYQDSLAWGLFKQKKCKEALDVMKKVTEKLNDKEIEEHDKAIKKCVAKGKTEQ